MTESMPDPDATKLDAPASPLDTPLITDPEEIARISAQATMDLVEPMMRDYLALRATLAEFRDRWFAVGFDATGLTAALFAYLDRDPFGDAGAPSANSADVGQSSPSCGNSQCTLCPPKGPTA